MYFYKLYGLIFKSNVEIEQLLVSEEHTNFDVEIVFGDVPLEIKAFIQKGDETGYKEDGYWFINDRAIFLVEEGKKITVEMLNNVSIANGIPFVLGYCISMLFGQRNMLAIHCSCVEVDNQAIIIAGYSGSGKSSLTTKFLDYGYRLMTDDIAIVDIKDNLVMVYPGFPHQNLCKDVVESYGYDKQSLPCADADRDKYRISRLDAFCDVPTPMKAMFILNKYTGDQVVIEEITGTNKLKYFINNLFNEPIIKTYGFPHEHMKRVLQIIQNIPLYLIQRPANGNTTEIQMKKIKELIEQERGYASSFA
jgi:hypothetical protein